MNKMCCNKSNKIELKYAMKVYVRLYLFTMFNLKLYENYLNILHNFTLEILRGINFSFKCVAYLKVKCMFQETAKMIDRGDIKIP